MHRYRFATANVLFALLVSWAGTATCQTENAAIHFESLSLRPGEKGSNATKRIRMENSGDNPIRVRIDNYSLLDLLLSAYGVPPQQVSGPNWLDNKVFTIEAKMPEGVTREQLPILLQNLLAEQFKLKIHTEKKNVSAYELVVEKNGPKFKPSVEEAKPVVKAPPTGPIAKDKDGYPILDGRDSVMSPDKSRMHANEAMPALAAFISNQMRVPVRDGTNLAGKYDITISWDARPTGNAVQSILAVGGTTLPDASQLDFGPSLAKALSQQLGLKLEQKKLPLDVLVVDHLEPTPAN